MQEQSGEEVVDLLIIGAGPAGLSAAVNAKARNLKATLIDSREPVQGVRGYSEVTNYLGFIRASGADLSDHFVQHFRDTGYRFVKDRVLKVMPFGDTLMVSAGASNFESVAVILSAGVSRSKTLPGEEQFLGRGVSYCVTCDGALYRGKDVVVVGYVPEGEEEANALAGFASSVTYIPMYEKVETLAQGIKVLRTQPTAVIGDGRADVLRTEAGELKAEGIFIIRQGIPVAALVDDIEFSDDFVHVNREMATNIPGLYAAGDCTGPPFQIAKAVGEGQVAAIAAAKYTHAKKKGSYPSRVQQ